MPLGVIVLFPIALTAQRIGNDQWQSPFNKIIGHVKVSMLQKPKTAGFGDDPPGPRFVA